MKSEHGFDCPISWDKVHLDHDWVTIEYNGFIYSYEFEPHYNGRVWIPCTFNFEPQGVTTPPTDASKCLWKRPKSIGILLGKDAGTSIDVIDNTLIG